MTQVGLQCTRVGALVGQLKAAGTPQRVDASQNRVWPPRPSAPPSCATGGRQGGAPLGCEYEPGYAPPMTNPYGITLDRAWTEWAAEYGVSPTVAAALFLISVHRPAHEVAAKLNFNHRQGRHRHDRRPQGRRRQRQASA